MNKSLGGNDSNPSTDYQHFAPEVDYYDFFYQVLPNSNDSERDRFSAIICMLRIVFVLFSRVGFILVQVGSIPVENVYIIILYNLLEIAVVLLSYGLVGSKLSFGPDTEHGWMARGGWNRDLSFESNLDQSVIGFCGCLLATAQMSSLLVGRISLTGGMILSVIYCSVFQPLLMHWIWEETGWLKFSNFLDEEVFVKDHAGALVLHIPSAVFGTMGALFLGRRIVKLRDLDKLSFGSENMLTITLGYFMIILGYFIFSLPSSLYEVTHVPPPYNYSAVIATNSLLAVGGGIFMLTVLQLVIFRHVYRYRRVIRCVQGGMAGLISISAAVDRYTPLAAVLMSLGSSMFFFFFAEILHNTALEDACSFISSHLICAFIGVVLCPLLAQKENFGTGTKLPSREVNTLWQLICTAVVISFSVLVSLFVFLLLKIMRVLRNNHEVVSHKRATIIRDGMAKRAFLERLFPINSTSDHVEPGYREEYSTTSKHTETHKNVASVPMTKSDAVRKREHQGKRGNKYEATVMTIDTELNSSGDYYDPYLDIKSVSDFNDSKRSIV